MGGNGSYSKELKSVPRADRTHIEAKTRIDGHKILIQKKNNAQTKTPVNSNSEKPVYLCGRVSKRDGSVAITTIAEYKNHRLIRTIDLKFDSDGNYVGYSGSGKGSHSHLWDDDVSRNEVGRKPHKKTNNLLIPKKYLSLIKKIEKYNKEHHKWNEEKLQ
ncbi:MAG: hypothetical protein J5693_02820 [Bacteroidales bacterium]|nr:hypothetical protein [Bacteroidales bacterium]